jgi:HEAT repeat protein
VVLLVLAALTATLSAGDPAVTKPAYDKALVEQNLLAGLASDNSGLQRSCALMLGQIGSKKAVIALMAKLRSSQDETVRIASAWALSRIGDPFGTYLVRMTVSFDDNARIRAYCAWYYNVNVKPGSFVIRELAEVVPTVALRWEPEPIAD